MRSEIQRYDDLLRSSWELMTCTNMNDLHSSISVAKGRLLTWNWERSTLTSKKAGFVPLFANRFYIMTVLWRLFFLYFKAASWKSCINRSAWRIVGILEVWPAVTHNTGVNVQEHGFQQNQNSSVSWTAIKFLQMNNNKTCHYAIMGRKPNLVPNYVWLIWVSGAHFFFCFINLQSWA